MRTMMEVLGGIFGIVIFLVGIWLVFVPSRSNKPKSIAQQDAETVRKIGFITGLRGGSVQDAAAATFAVRRLEEQTGKPATDLEIAVASSMLGPTKQGDR
jgi:hypothetical protein